MDKKHSPNHSASQQKKRRKSGCPNGWQALTDKKIQDLQADISQIKLFYGNDRSSLQYSLTNEIRKNAAQAAKLQSLGNKLSNTKKQHKQLSKKHKETIQKLKLSEETAAALSLSLQQSEKCLEQEKELVRQAGKDNGLLNERLTQNQQLLENALVEKNSILISLEQAQSQIQAAAEDNNSLSGRLAKTQALLGQEKSSNEDLSARLNDSGRQLTMAKSKLSSLSEEHRQAKNSLENELATKQRVLEAYSHLKNEHQQLSQKLEQAQKMLEQQNISKGQLESQLNQAEAALSRALNSNQDLTDKLHTLEATASQQAEQLDGWAKRQEAYTQFMALPQDIRNSFSFLCPKGTFESFIAACSQLDNITKIYESAKFMIRNGMQADEIPGIPSFLNTLPALYNLGQFGEPLSLQQVGIGDEFISSLHEKTAFSSNQGHITKVYVTGCQNGTRPVIKSLVEVQ